jgi:vitamin K-dependent gamma-carboxylase-like protein
VIAAIERRFFEPGPATRLAALRVLVGLFGTVFLCIRSGYLLDVAVLPRARFQPVGPLAFLDDPLPLWMVRAGIVLGIVLGVAFIAGWRYRFTAPAYAIVLLALTTYDNSWQHVAHTQNLLVLHTAVLSISPAARVWSLDARRHGSTVVPDDATFGWPVRLMSLLTVITYVVAGLAKLRHGGMDWLTGDVLRNQIAHDNLRKITLGDVHSPLGGRLVRYGWLFPPLAVASMLVELGAPLALVRGRLRTAWVTGAWFFHVGVLALMAILFAYPLSGVAFASLLHPERAVEWAKARRNVTASALSTSRSGPTVG